MQTAHNDPNLEWTKAIFARLTVQWEAWKNKDAAANNAVIDDNFSSFSADGLYRTGRPTMQQMIEQPIIGYQLSEFRVLPVGADTALVTYFADIKTPGDVCEHHMAVGEFWIKRNGKWFIRGFSGTLMK